MFHEVAPAELMGIVGLPRSVRYLRLSDEGFECGEMLAWRLSVIDDGVLFRCVMGLKTASVGCC